MQRTVANKWGAPACLLALLLWAAAAQQQGSRVPRIQCDYQKYGNESIYDFDAEDLMGTRNVSLADYRGKQEPGSNGTEIINGIRFVRPGNGFLPNFELFKKNDVNGESEQPIFTFLKKHCPSTRTGFASKDSLMYNRFQINDIRWNFEKFLISRTGVPIMRFDPSTNPMDMIDDVEALISRNDV